LLGPNARVELHERFLFGAGGGLDEAVGCGVVRGQFQAGFQGVFVPRNVRKIACTDFFFSFVIFLNCTALSSFYLAIFVVVGRRCGRAAFSLTGSFPCFLPLLAHVGLCRKHRAAGGCSCHIRFLGGSGYALSLRKPLRGCTGRCFTGCCRQASSGFDGCCNGILGCLMVGGGVTNLKSRLRQKNLSGAFELVSVPPLHEKTLAKK
jgi:hypothetical protein